MALTVRIRQGDNGTIVEVSGDMDVCAEVPFQRILLHITGLYSPRLLLDLTGVSFMDCAGLRALLRARRRVESGKGSIRIVAASPAVRRLISLAGMKDAFRGPGGPDHSSLVNALPG